MTSNEIRLVGVDALLEALGPVGMARFFQQFETGKGDYTKDREQWLGCITVETAIKEMEALKKNPC
jgi:hypothetical protein